MSEKSSSSRPDILPFNIRLDREAVQVLRQHCPKGTKGVGRFVSRLILEERARQEERQRLRERVATALEGEGR
jgi:hypothetical protein